MRDRSGSHIDSDALCRARRSDEVKDEVIGIMWSPRSDTLVVLDRDFVASTAGQHPCNEAAPCPWPCTRCDNQPGPRIRKMLSVRPRSLNERGAYVPLETRSSVRWDECRSARFDSDVESLLAGHSPTTETGMMNVKDDGDLDLIM